MDFSNYWWQAADAAPSVIDHSLRFRGAQELQRTTNKPHSTAGQCYSAWVKSADFTGTIMSRPIVSGTSEIAFTWHNQGVAFRDGSSGGNNTTNPNDGDVKHRDPSAWHHVFTRVTTSQAQTYINGELLGSDVNLKRLFLFDNSATNNRNDFTIGNRSRTPNGFFNGYMAEIHAIDGQALQPTAFGQYNANGVWVPRAYTGTYGANGFYLDFSDPADIGADRSGNGNNFTPSGFELANQASVNWDHIADNPTNNFLTYNPLDKRAANISGYSKANLFYSNTANTVHSSGYLTAAIPGPERYAFDLYTANTADNAYQLMGGVTRRDVGVSSYPGEVGGNSVSISVRKSTDRIVAYKNGNSSNLAAPWPGNNQWLTWLLDCRTAGQVTLRIVASDGSTYGSVVLDHDWSESEIIINSRAVGAHYDSGNMANATRNALPGGYRYLNSNTFAATPIPNQITGTFTGNNSADGPFVYTGCIPARIQYGTVDVKYQDRFAQSNVDFLSNGFKVRSTASNSGTVNYTVTTIHDGGEYNGFKIPFSAPAPAVSN